MAYKNTDLERVYCTCRAIFSGNDALLRKKKKVKEVLVKNTTTVRPLFFGFGEEKTILMSQYLLECRVFESDLRAKVMFPSLFQSTPQQDADREASEADAVRSVANALDEMSQSEGEDDDDELDQIPESYPEEAIPTPIAEDAPEDAPPADEPLALFKAITPPQDVANVCDIDSGKSCTILQLRNFTDKALGVTLASPPPHPGLPSLYPACLPYNTQHDILTTTQRVLEECCFYFATKWIPHVLHSQGWDSPSAVELTKWTKVFNRAGLSLPAHATTPANTSIKDVLFRTHQLRHIAVHRQPTTAREVSQHLRTALRVAETLQDVSRAAQLEDLMSEVDEKIKAMVLTKNVLENRTLFSLDDIRRQREELNRQEKELIENMVREDRDHKALIGRLLEAAVDDIFEKKAVRGQILEEAENDAADIYYEASEDTMNGAVEDYENAYDILLSEREFDCGIVQALYLKVTHECYIATPPRCGLRTQNDGNNKARSPKMSFAPCGGLVLIDLALTEIAGRPEEESRSTDPALGRIKTDTGLSIANQKSESQDPKVNARPSSDRRPFGPLIAVVFPAYGMQKIKD
ncbi:hypothetical protein CFIO01_03560 [Colletotrichum fioriniae PJ7]|uniref:Ubiquinol-cytochrome-c reductase cytochrome c1 n=1 Tax=Colletotrichum fioriniae PJ7 TaxID=1445577 RepID=A0A010Q8H6_9PEZI|nr:hypothetical protein CFIO01_03560 [Colletotrichum fioriniae PJ7]